MVTTTQLNEIQLVFIWTVLLTIDLVTKLIHRTLHVDLYLNP